MSSFEKEVCAQLAKEALAAAERLRNPELKQAVLEVATPIMNRDHY